MSTQHDVKLMVEEEKIRLLKILLRNTDLQLLDKFFDLMCNRYTELDGDEPHDTTSRY